MPSRGQIQDGRDQCAMIIQTQGFHVVPDLLFHSKEGHYNVALHSQLSQRVYTHTELKKGAYPVLSQFQKEGAHPLQFLYGIKLSLFIAVSMSYPHQLTYDKGYNRGLCLFGTHERNHEMLSTVFHR